MTERLPMKKGIIGIDTSCYTTSVAIVDTDGNILANERLLLPVAKGDGGLRQSEGVFLHVKQLPMLFEKMKAAAKEYEPVALCVSIGPTRQENSYMPVFLVGKMAAEAMSTSSKVSCFFTDHQSGHIEAAKIGTGMDEGDFLALHLSGGTTQVLCCREDEINQVGGSKDLHAGQLVDRVGVALGCSFPAGKELEALAVQGASKSMLPTSMADGDLCCHLSGAEAQAFRWIKEKKMAKEDIAAEIYSFLVRSVSKMMIAHGEKWQIKQVLLAGGVASSALFKKQLLEYMKKRAASMKIYFAQPELAGDNAVGVAMIGRNEYMKKFHQ